LSLTVAALAACDLPTSATLDPSAVVTGIYTEVATTQSDSCVPQRFVGAATVPVFADPSTISFMDAATSATIDSEERIDLVGSAGYAADYPAAGTTVPPCPSGGSFELAFTLTAASGSGFEVLDDETWTIVTACPVTIIDTSTVPNTTCAADRTLAYTLIQACPSPCTIVLDETSTTPTCTCPQGSGSAM
jgi:hypothetical protein